MRPGRGLLTAAFILLGAGAAAAHPFHVTIAEAELNPKTGMLEVALWINPTDLEQALAQRTGARVDIEKTPKVDKLIADLLREKIRIIKPDGKALSLQWVGKEVSLKATWLYFQFPCKQSLKGAKIKNALFLDTVPKQVNTINVKEGKRRGTVHCTRREPQRPLRYVEPKKRAPKMRPPG